MSMGTATSPTVAHGSTIAAAPGGAARVSAPDRSRPPRAPKILWEGAYWQVMKPSRAARRHLPTSPFKPPPPAPAPKEFALQDQVTHDKYGLGRVIEVGDGHSVLVDFGTQKVRIPAPYAKLFKL